MDNRGTRLKGLTDCGARRIGDQLLIIYKVHGFVTLRVRSVRIVQRADNRHQTEDVRNRDGEFSRNPESNLRC